MAKEAVSPEEQALENAKNRTEGFFENNSKTVIAGLIAIFVLAAAIFGYRKLIVEPRMDKAQEMLYGAQYRFEEQTPDYELALNGDQSAPGFAEVVETYGGTPAGNLARYYAAACCMHLGDMAQAEQYLAKFKHVKGKTGKLINAMAEGLKGDIAVDNGDYTKAAAHFEKAVNVSDNVFTAPMYLRKAAMAYKAAGNKAKADACLETIRTKYPSSIDARDAEKYLAQ